MENTLFTLTEHFFTKNKNKLANDEAAFNNTYTANKLEVSNQVTGNLGDKSKYFDFTIT